MARELSFFAPLSFTYFHRTIFVQNEIKIQFVGENTYEKLYVIGNTKERESMTVFH